MRRRGVVLALALLTVFAAFAVLAPVAIAQRMDVPAWKQGDPAWSALRLGRSTYTMGRSGCAVTATAMVAAYFGSSKDPGKLCRALSATGGLTSDGDLNWQAVPGAARGTIKYVGRYGGSDLRRVNRELDAGYPVIVKVNRKGNTHFVVLTGRSGATYYMNDPAYGDRAIFNERYGNPRTAIRGFRVFHGSHSSVTTSSHESSEVIRYQQANRAVRYQGTWKVSSSKSASGGSFRFADSAGASLTVTFKGTYLGWIAKKSPLYGRARVTLDGGKPVIVDLYAARALWQQTVWKTGHLEAGTHTVKIEWTGKRSAAATDANVGVDGFDVHGTLMAARR